MLVRFGNSWFQTIPLTAKFWLSSEFFSSNYFQIRQHVVELHSVKQDENCVAQSLLDKET